MHNHRVSDGGWWPVFLEQPDYGAYCGARVWLWHLSPFAALQRFCLLSEGLLPCA